MVDYWTKVENRTKVETRFEIENRTKVNTVEPGDSKPLDSKLLALVNFFPLINSLITQIIL